MRTSRLNAYNTAEAAKARARERTGEPRNERPEGGSPRSSAATLRSPLNPGRSPRKERRWRSRDHGGTTKARDRGGQGNTKGSPTSSNPRRLGQRPEPGQASTAGREVPQATGRNHGCELRTGSPTPNRTAQHKRKHERSEPKPCPGIGRPPRIPPFGGGLQVGSAKPFRENQPRHRWR